jgi:methylthioribose-1-phosphate isomerase
MSLSTSLQSLKYSRGSLKVLDQLKLPDIIEYVDINSVEDAWKVIRLMQVRGAPLIAITAALGIAVDLNNKILELSQKTSQDVASIVLEKILYLRTSRPTAVNLFVATDELTAIVNSSLKQVDITPLLLINNFVEAAEKIFEDDIATNKLIGQNGAKRILELVDRSKIRVLTICNTGSLATAGYGTALGVVRSLNEAGKLEHVFACETRPYNQGARLTAFEIVQDGLPGTLITDSMASALMAVKGIDCVVLVFSKIKKSRQIN